MPASVALVAHEPEHQNLTGTSYFLKYGNIDVAESGSVHYIKYLSFNYDFCLCTYPVSDPEHLTESHLDRTPCFSQADASTATTCEHSN